MPIDAKKGRSPILKKPKKDARKSPYLLRASVKKLSDLVPPTSVGVLAGRFLIPGGAGIVIGGLAGLATGSLLGKEKEKDMDKVPVFYSFHFGNDVMRVQQVRNIGSIEGNEPTTPQSWERLKRTGNAAVEKWIDDNMKYKRCVIVLVGSETANRPWVRHEIIKAWDSGKPLMGIYIHNLKCPRNGTSLKGANPFASITTPDGSRLSSYVPCYNPNTYDAYNDIATNIGGWINDAISNKAN